MRDFLLFLHCVKSFVEKMRGLFLVFPSGHRVDYVVYRGGGWTIVQNEWSNYTMHRVHDVLTTWNEKSCGRGGALCENDSDVLVLLSEMHLQHIT